jgi:hypothetical protein
MAQPAGKHRIDLRNRIPNSSNHDVAHHGQTHAARDPANLKMSGGSSAIWRTGVRPTPRPGRDLCCLWRRVVIASTASLEFPSAHVRIGPALGITPRNADRPGHTVYVFVDSMLSVAFAGRVSVATLLAYVMAHELGHSLDGGHTTGVMRAAWTETDVTKLKQKTLAFQPDQARLIRAFVGNALPGS